MNDAELLREFVERGQEAAFAQLVERHLNLVYSTALRMVREPALAEDVAQSVFVHLARKAPTIRDGQCMPGWLYRVTHCQAANAVRAEQTRRRYEAEAMKEAQSDLHATWESISSRLEEAIATLNPAEQDLVLMRYFQNRSWREVGAAVALSEDTVQRRMDRALNKLRAYFGRQGIAASACAIGPAVAAHAVHAAPSGLAASVTAASLAQTAGGSSPGLLLILKTLLMKKTTIALITVALAAVVSFFALQTSSRSRAENANQPVTQKSLAKGLVSHFKFDQDETPSGVKDASGCGHGGKVSGAHWTPDGHNGGAYEFTADGDEIVVPNSKALNPERLTLAAWVKTSQTDALWRRIFDKSYTRGYALSIAGDWQQNQWRGLASMEIGPGTHFVLTKTKVADGQWHHLVMTCDGTEEVLYVDGRPEGRLHWNTPGHVGSTDFDLVIGCNRSNVNEDDYGTSFRGMIDEPMIWDRALSAEEVRFLFESQGGAPERATAAN